MEVYLDLNNSMMNIGEANPKSVNQTAGGFVSYPSDGNNWIIKIRDIRYNSTSANFSSLNDTFTRPALLDTAFSGIAVPYSIWSNVEKYLLSSMTLPSGSVLTCNF